jgi:hypothetical protein
MYGYYKCIDNNQAPEITVGKIYELIKKVPNEGFVIKNDLGNKKLYFEYRFERVRSKDK